jgi:hypothetical protein
MKKEPCQTWAGANGIQEVKGSIPFRSTKIKTNNSLIWRVFLFCFGSLKREVARIRIVKFEKRMCLNYSTGFSSLMILAEESRSYKHVEV